MDRQRIRPAFVDLLNSDPHLPEMIGYVQQLVNHQEPQVVAGNAALAYLALITAFSDRGLLQVDWAPRIVIEVDSKEFEVSPRFNLSAILVDFNLLQIVLDGHGIPEDQIVFPSSQMEENGSAFRGNGAYSHSRPVKTKLDMFLESLSARDFSDIELESDTTEFAANELVQRDPESLSADVIVENIVNHLRAVQGLDRRAVSLSIAINIAYWRLGKEFVSFIEVSLKQFGLLFSVLT